MASTVTLFMILCLGPHIDDVILGMGATLAHLPIDEVQVITFSPAEQSNPNHDTKAQERAAFEEYGITQVEILDFPVRQFHRWRDDIREYCYQLNDADRVYLPASGDQHQDHQVITEEAKRTMRTQTLLGYIHPHNHWSEAVQWFETVSEADLALQQRAMQHYAGQQHKNYFHRLRTKMAFYGLKVNRQYAEPFTVERMVHDPLSK